MLEHIEEERRIAYAASRARATSLCSRGPTSPTAAAAAGGNAENTAAAGAAAPAKRSRFLFGLQTTVGASGATLRARLAAVARHRQLNDMREWSPVEGWTECVKRE